jgi:hypothetical protein
VQQHTYPDRSAGCVSVCADACTDALLNAPCSIRMDGRGPWAAVSASAFRSCGSRTWYWRRSPRASMSKNTVASHSTGVNVRGCASLKHTTAHMAAAIETQAPLCGCQVRGCRMRVLARADGCGVDMVACSASRAMGSDGRPCPALLGQALKVSNSVHWSRSRCCFFPFRERECVCVCACVCVCVGGESNPEFKSASKL